MNRLSLIVYSMLMAALLSISVGDAAAGERRANPNARATDRVLRKEVVVNGPIEEVWRCWTTSEGIASFFSPESNIKLEIGGPYELLMRATEPDKQGKRGSEGCKVLSYIPHEMLAFEWNFPPTIERLRYSGAKTQVVLRFNALEDGRVRVRFAQLGWQEGEDWEKGFAYFDQAWTKVLKQLQQRTGTRSATPMPSKKSKNKSWQDGNVKVTSTESPLKRQDFELAIPAPVEEVWKLLTTEEGFRRIGSKEPRVELRPDGAYAFWPGAPNRVLAFVPHEMLSTSGGAPAEFPNVRKGGTWSAYFLEPLDGGKTKLRLTVLGWRPGEKEWDDAYDYFLKGNPKFLNSVCTLLSGEDRAMHGTEAHSGKKAAVSRAEACDVLRHEGIIDAPVAEVWAAFTTKEGLESWMVPHAEIDLRVGGLMRTHYDPKGVIGDENTIENTILSYEPRRMLSIKATKPPANFQHKEAIKNMWSVIYFEPIEEKRTRVTVVGLGYGDDEASQKLRQHFEWGNAWTLQQLQKHYAPKTEDDGKAP